MEEEYQRDALRIGVVIPVYRDRDALERLIPELLVRGWSPGELVVVLGESDPAAAEVAREKDVAWITSESLGRARQLNAGARFHAGVDLLLFLHADTIPPAGARSLMASAVRRGRVGGAFARRFDHLSTFLRLSCRLADWRGRWFGWFFGDQAIFATREAFEQIGGFPDQAAFEDLEFSRALARTGPVELLSPPVISSGRRFLGRGPVLQTLYDLGLTLGYLWNARKAQPAPKSDRVPANPE